MGYKGKGSLSYMGIDKELPEVKTASADPTSANSNFDPGDIWVNSSANTIFMLEKKPSGVASWIPLLDANTFDATDFDVTAGVVSLDAGIIQKAVVAVTTLELAALAATPKTLVAAPGADKYLEYLGGNIALIFGTTAIDSATSDGNLVIQTGTTGTDVSLTVEAAGLVDAAANAVSTAKPLATDVVLDANETLELLNDGAEFTVTGGGDGTLQVTVYYRILDLS